MTFRTNLLAYTIPASVLLHFILISLLNYSFWDVSDSVKINLGETKEITLLADAENWKLVDSGISSESIPDSRNRSRQSQDTRSELSTNDQENLNPFSNSGLTDQNLDIGSTLMEGNNQKNRENTDLAIPVANSTANASPKQVSSNQTQKLISHSGLMSRTQVGRQNLKSSVRLMGAFQLSSYEWEYAGYMETWIQKIKRNWIEPISYLAGKGKGGIVQVEVKVNLDGTLKDLKVTYSNVNTEMMQSAFNAVKSSFNLQPLPDGFHEAELGVLFNLVYPVY